MPRRMLVVRNFSCHDERFADSCGEAEIRSNAVPTAAGSLYSVRSSLCRMGYILPAEIRGQPLHYACDISHMRTGMKLSDLRRSTNSGTPIYIVPAVRRTSCSWSISFPEVPRKCLFG